MTKEDFYSFLLDHEGRTITNDPRDPGGMTAWGISRAHHPLWEGWQMVDLGITSGPAFEHNVNVFYESQYQDLWREFPERLREVVIDTAVNMGRGYAIQCLQDALNRLAGSKYVHIDGNYGKITREAVKHANTNALAFTMCAIRMAEYSRRAAKDSCKRVFLQGWLNRVRDLMAVI